MYASIETLVGKVNALKNTENTLMYELQEQNTPYATQNKL